MSGEGGSTELLGEGVGWGEPPLVSPQRLQFSPQVPRARGKPEGTLSAVTSLAVHIGSKREGFTGGQDGGRSSPDPTRCQATRRKKLQRQKKGHFPSSPLCHFFCLGCCIGWSRLVVCVPTHVRAPLSTSVTVGLRVIVGCG